MIAGGVRRVELLNINYKIIVRVSFDYSTEYCIQFNIGLFSLRQ